jgi:hypothetical protein
MVPAKSEEAIAGFPGGLLNELARDEHDRWMTAKMTAGWTFGPRTDDKARRHEALLPWDQLPDSQKDKDRALVTGIPVVLGQCGYAVLPVPE